MATRRIVVAVTPGLMQDAVSRALAVDGYVCVEPPDQEGADVAVVTSARRGEINLDRVIVLQADDEAAEGAVKSLSELRTALAHELR